jgi:hypothetical protein
MSRPTIRPPTVKNGPAFAGHGERIVLPVPRNRAILSNGSAGQRDDFVDSPVQVAGIPWIWLTPCLRSDNSVCASLPASSESTA